MKLKNPDGKFTTEAKVLGMIGSSITILFTLGGAAFVVDERHAHTIEVAEQFKAIEESRDLRDLQTEQLINLARLDSLENRLYMEKAKDNPDPEIIERIERSIRRIEIRQQTIETLILQMQ